MICDLGLGLVLFSVLSCVAADVSPGGIRQSYVPRYINDSFPLFSLREHRPEENDAITFIHAPAEFKK